MIDYIYEFLKLFDKLWFPFILKWEVSSVFSKLNIFCKITLLFLSFLNSLFFYYFFVYVYILCCNSLSGSIKPSLIFYFCIGCSNDSSLSMNPRCIIHFLLSFYGEIYGLMKPNFIVYTSYYFFLL